MHSVAAGITAGAVITASQHAATAGKIGYDWWKGNVEEFNEPDLMKFHLLMELSALMSILEKTTVQDEDVIAAAKVATGSLINLIRAVGIVLQKPEDAMRQGIDSRDHWLYQLSHYAELLLITIKDPRFNLRIYEVIDIIKHRDRRTAHFKEYAKDVYYTVRWDDPSLMKRTITYQKFLEYVSVSEKMIVTKHQQEEGKVMSEQEVKYLLGIQVMFLGCTNDSITPQTMLHKFKEMFASLTRTGSSNRIWRSDMLIHLLIHNQNKATLQLMISHQSALNHGRLSPINVLDSPESRSRQFKKR